MFAAVAVPLGVMISFMENAFGVTVGTGVFFGEEDESTIDLAFQYARRGNLAKNGLEEEIFRLSVSFNGSDNWW